MNSIGLNGSLLLGAQSLANQQAAISTIGNNISNINTRTNIVISVLLTRHRC